MDITPQDTTIQPMSDDQELAKALAGVLPDEPIVQKIENSTAMNYEEIHVPTPTETLDSNAPFPAAAESLAAPFEVPAFSTELPTDTPATTPFEMPAMPVIGSSASNSDLENIKKDAIEELRPLIDHVDLPPEEKFDTYLLLIRSTDDASLIGPAHLAAQNISNEKRKAEALLDIIKEIDYLSKKDSTA